VGGKGSQESKGSGTLASKKGAAKGTSTLKESGIREKDTRGKWVG